MLQGKVAILKTPDSLGKCLPLLTIMRQVPICTSPAVRNGDESAQRPENIESPWVGFVSTRGTVQGKMQRTKDIDVSVVASPTYEARMRLL